MKQKSTFLKVFMTLMLLCGVSSVWAGSSYTIKFTKGQSDSGTGAPSISEGSEFATLSANSYAYARTNGMHLSSGSNAGNATLTMKDAGKVVASSIVINALAKSGKSFSVEVTYADGSSDKTSFTPGTTTTDNTFVLSNTNKQKISSIYLSASKSTGVGIASVKVVYEDESKELVSLKVTGTPSKTTYETGETFNPAGLTVSGTYSDSSTDDLTDEAEWTFDPATFTSTSQTSVSVTAMVSGKSDTKEYNVTVNEHVVKPGTYEISLNNALYGISTGNNGEEQSATKNDITIVSGCQSSAQSKTYYDADHIRYYTKSYLNLIAPDGYQITKIEFTAYDKNWDDSGVSANSGAYSSKIWTGSSAEVEFSFGAQCRAASIQVTYEAPKTLTGIAVKSAPTKTEYFVDDEFDPAGLEITATYDDASTKDIEYNATDFALSGYDSKTAGKQTITVTYKEKTATFDVTVKARTLTAIAISGDLKKTTYVEGDEFEFDGLTAQGTYNDGSYKNLTDEVEWSVSPSTLTASVTSVTVTATLGTISGTKDFDITVNEKSIANTYTSNVLLSTDGGTSASKATVKWNDSDYDAIKAGTGKVKGSCVVYIPEGTKTLHFHAAAWKDEQVTLTVNGTNYYELKADAGVNSNSPFTLNNDPETNDYFTFETDGSTTAITFEATGEGCRFVLFGVNVDDEAKQNVTITDAGWATACLPMNATVSGATAYYAKVDNGEIVKTEANVIPAGTGVLLKGKGTATFTVSNESVDDTSDNMLKGSLVKKTFKESNKVFYILTNGEKGIGFYWDPTTKDFGASASCGAGKAVLEGDASTANNFFTFEDVTAIEAVKNETANAKRYNLNGQAVGADYKGIVIMNGKKMFNK